MPENLPTILIIAVIAVVCVIAVFSIIKRAKSGCCGAGGGDIEEHIKKDISDYSNSCTVKIGGMHCDKCANRIATAFNRQDGVYAEVDWRSGMAHILSKEPLPELLIRRTVIGLDYTVDSISEDK